MAFRRFASLALAVTALACQSSIPNQAPPQTIAFAVSFPDTSDGTQSFQPPLPNDLVLQAATSSPPPGVSAAQLALLEQFARSGGFPNDQEVPIQIQFFAVKPDPAGGNPTAAPFPDVDTTTVTPGTLALLRLDTGTPTPVEFEVAPTDYSATTGILTIHKKVDPANGARWWPTGTGGGRYVVALRGGDKGVKTKSGEVIAAQVSALLISQDKDLTKAENQGLLATLPNPAAAAARLEQIRQLYANPVKWVDGAAGWAPGPADPGLVSAFAAVDTVFPHKELATIQSFVVDPNPHVAVDATGGIVPLPSEFLMDPQSYYTAGPLSSHVQNVAAFGALAPGIATLDGFGTSPLIFAPTAGTPIAAASVTSSSVVLMKNTDAAPGVLGAGTWEKVTEFPADPVNGTYLTLPPPLTVDPATGNPCTLPYASTCVAKVIGLQPAVAVPLQDGSFHALSPLADHTEYAVIVTSDMKDVLGNPVAPNTIAKIIAIARDPQTPIVDAQGHSLLAGVPDENAQLLAFLATKLPAEVTAVVTAAASQELVDPAKVVFAYTFPTQSILAPAQLLAQIPSGFGIGGNPIPNTLRGVSAPIGPEAIAKKYGIVTAPLRNPANAQLLPVEFREATLVTLDRLDPQSGAFVPASATGTAAQVPVLTATLPAAALAVPPAGRPVVVFRHGINGGRGQMLLAAATLASQGFLVAAIDAAKFGDRSWCATDADCAAGTCDHSGFGDQGDSANARPGLCTGGLVQVPVQAGIPTCSASVIADCWDGTGGIAKASGNFFLSGNLFRLRDSMRQDIIDEAALVQAVVHSANDALQLGVTVDPSKVFYVGQSLGSINGVADIAVNTVFKRAVLNVGGATFVDIAENSPAFQQELDSVLAAQSIERGTAAFLQFVQVSKWIIDPAEPVNFAATLRASGRPVLGQAARCDDVVPNTENALFYGLLGLAPVNPTATTTDAGTTTLEWYMQDQTTPCPTDGTTGRGAGHGFLLDFVNPGLTTKAQANVAAFLNSAPPAAGPATTPVLP